MYSGVYLHIPFCKSRCSYCDFATEVWRSGDAVQRYVDALCREINSAAPALTGGRSSGTPDLRIAAGTVIDTVYFGGGTPSLLSPNQVEQILDAVTRRLDVSENAEITMEMNPATVTPETLEGYRSLGVNRASFGVQTFNDRDLKLLARGHDAQDARNTYRLLRSAGFENISFDLIAGLPGQSLGDWERNLDEAIKLSPEHLSLYLLEIHEGTPLAAQLRSGRRPLPDEEVAAAMYEMMIDRLAAEGYEQYEISNFARPGFSSRHNTKYWRLEPVFGFGVSAHSFDGSSRYSNESDTAEYVRQVEATGNAVAVDEPLTARKMAGEFAFLNLRLTRGLNLEEYRSRFQKDLFTEFSEELCGLQDNGLIALTPENIKLTRKGMLYSNEVFSVFV